MNRRTFLGSPAALAGASLQTRAPGGGSRPNVIWLFADQHRAQALSCNGDPNVSTPNIDNLSSLGVNFTRAVSSFPLCCPFRGSVLTSRWAHHCVVGHEYALPEGQPTIAKPFHDAGYHTAYFGKWHLAGHKEATGRGAFHITDPDKRGGFEHWVGYENNNSQWDSWVHGGRGRDAFHYRLPGYETDELTNLLIKYVGERGEEAKAGRAKPFFAVLSVQPPHDPYVAPPDYMHRFNPNRLEMRPNVPGSPEVQSTARRELAGYYAMIENWDHNIGRVRESLDKAGLGFNTHLVVFSDHGDMHGSHGMYRKTNPFEESVRVPFILAGEEPRYNNRANSRPDAVLTTVDIAPTTLGLCGIDKPSWMEGYDYSHLRLTQRKAAGPAPDSAFLQNVVPTGHAHSINKPYRGIVTRDGWKYVSFAGMPWLLYNLNEDPYEQANLAHNNRYRAERRKLAARLRQWVADTGDRFEVAAE
ncbi:MAG: sulfatase [Bryobacteraceae bacterium]